MIGVTAAFALGVASGVIGSALFCGLMLAIGGAIWRWRRGQ